MKQPLPAPRVEVSQYRTNPSRAPPPPPGTAWKAPLHLPPAMGDTAFPLRPEGFSGRTEGWGRFPDIILPEGKLIPVFGTKHIGLHVVPQLPWVGAGG